MLQYVTPETLTPWAVMAWSRIRTECVTAVVAGANFLI